MQKKVIRWLFVPLLVLNVGASQAKERRQAPTRNEKVARAQWQPVRQTSQVESIQPGSVVELDAYPSEGEVYLDPLPMQGGPACDAIGPAGACDAVGCDACGPRLPRWRPCMTLCLPRDGWASFEYLLWYQKGMNLPPLVSQQNAGPVLFGDDQVLEDSLNGGRLQVGLWLDADHEWAVEGEFFSMGTTSTGFASRRGDLERRYLDVDNSLQETPLPINLANIGVRSQLEGAGFHFRRKLCGSEGCGNTLFHRLPPNYKSQFSGLIGYRWLQLEEEIGIDSIATGPPIATVRDFFDTRTQFNGIDIGAFYSRQRGCWTLDLQTKLALGTNRQTVFVQGSTDNDDGGLLALPSNSGIFKRDRFAVVPELNAKLGYQLTPRLQATVGYTFIYWSNVVRSGDQISRIVDADQVPALAGNAEAEAPAFAFNEVDYWVQGVSFGGEYCW